MQVEIPERIVELRDVNLAALADAAFDAHLSNALALIKRGNEMHFALAAVNPFAIYELVTTCQNLLGWDEAPHPLAPRHNFL